MNARWPEAASVDDLLLKSSNYLMDACHDFRVRYKQFMIPPKAGKGMSEIVIETLLDENP